MKPESNSRRLFGITRSKGKMYELGVPESSHLAVPSGTDPQELFVLTIGTLGDAAAQLNDLGSEVVDLEGAALDDLEFSASFFDAFVRSRFAARLSRETCLLASSAYYLTGRPGSSLVLARSRREIEGEAALDRVLHWVLLARWASPPAARTAFFGGALDSLVALLSAHFLDGVDLAEINSALVALRRRAYDGGSAHDVLFVDILAAVARKRVAGSAWTTLPGFTGVDITAWAGAIRRPEFPKELWPSQLRLGRAGIFAGASGVVQMPTSSGKTRSIEIVLRSAFLARRTKVAVVVAPFRALCHEIGGALRRAFLQDDVSVNELSDTLQLDFLQQIAEIFGSEPPVTQYVLVLTPEKLLYILRQSPDLVTHLGIVIYDEGHQFDSGSRGITYELLLTEIKALLSAHAQTILVSAVIQNAQAVGDWLIGTGATVVDGRGLLPTTRAVAFASWRDTLGQLRFFEQQDFTTPDYFVPRVIEAQSLTNRGKETKARLFPEKAKPNDVAGYLGVRLVPQGAVAIFCGRKDTANSIARRLVEVYQRGFALAPPADSADAEELRRMKNLLYAHFGAGATVSGAAAIGVFVHHGATPHGVRLSIEYGMQQGRLTFVVCTSTLAQGVNLPIRYLIVSGTQQAGERIKVRDFQNLIGRAGRAGVHTEGLIIFSDTRVFDTRSSESWRFNNTVSLLSPENSEITTSSLLGLLAPFRSVSGANAVFLPPADLCSLLLLGEAEWVAWADVTVATQPHVGVTQELLLKDMQTRRQLLRAVESYLMANRGAAPLTEFKGAAEELATRTLAYHLADDESRTGLRLLFVAVAEYLDRQQPNAGRQAVYAKTLLGVDRAKAVEQWVEDNRADLLALESNEQWITAVWPLLSALSDPRSSDSLQPPTLSFDLAKLWLEGRPYSALFQFSVAQQGTKAWGLTKRAALTDDDIVGFCENTLGFEYGLIVAAVAQFLHGRVDIRADGANALGRFQKALKYGLAESLAISCYDFGFADRIVAQRVADAVAADGFVGDRFGAAVAPHSIAIGLVLNDLPSYFSSVVPSLT